MDAVISGRTGRALLLDNGSLMSLDVDDLDTLVPRRQADLHFLFGDARDLQVIENADRDQIARELEHAYDCSSALDLALISLDAELSDEVRKEALEVLDGLLSDSRVIAHLESILYARSLPEDGDLAGALKLSGGAHSPTAAALLGRFETRQPLISKVSEAWDAIPIKSFGGYEQQAEFQHIAVREGLFRRLVMTLESQSTVSTFLIYAGLNCSIGALRNHRQILQAWAESFRKQQVRRDIRHEVEDARESESFDKTKRRRRKGIDRASVLEKVDSQKALIVETMHCHEIERVRTLVSELVAFQLKNGEPIFAVKSLCDLAIEAKSLGIYPLQLELTEQCIDVKDDDGWAWTQYGDALLNAHRLEDALEAFEQAGAFGAGVVASTGKAEVLKAMGQLDDSLATFDSIIAIHPEDVVAKNGRAEVLKAMGRLDDSLVAFDLVIAAHPEDVVAKNGRAEVLKAMGRLDDSLAAFDLVIAAHPENVVAKTGRAEVLKAMGRLDDSLAAFDLVIAAHPEHVVAKNGRAEVLKAMGQLDDSLAAFDLVIAAHPEDVVAKTGRAEVLKAMGQLDDSLAAFDLVIAAHPEDVVAKTGRSSVLVMLRRYDEALVDLPESEPATLNDWIGYHIRGMIFLRMGRISEAIQIFDHGSNEDPIPSSKEYFRTALACALLRQGDFPQANEILEDIQSPSLQPQVNVLRLYALGEMEEYELADETYHTIAAQPWSVPDALMDELHRRYILKEEPKQSNEWVLDKGENFLLLVANQPDMSSSYTYSA